MMPCIFEVSLKAKIKLLGFLYVNICFFLEVLEKKKKKVRGAFAQ